MGKILLKDWISSDKTIVPLSADAMRTGIREYKKELSKFEKDIEAEDRGEDRRPEGAADLTSNYRGFCAAQISGIRRSIALLEKGIRLLSSDIETVVSECCDDTVGNPAPLTEPNDIRLADSYRIAVIPRGGISVLGNTIVSAGDLPLTQELRDSVGLPDKYYVLRHIAENPWQSFYLLQDSSGAVWDLTHSNSEWNVTPHYAKLLDLLVWSWVNATEAYYDGAKR